ncbi:MAG: hypothetical protein H7840_04830 [Alphaproteobacteria bacterium]
MDKLQLIQYLANNTSSQKPAITTIARDLGVLPDTVAILKDEINSDGVFNIKSGKGGGLTLEGGIGKEIGVYPHVLQYAKKWVSDSIYGMHGVTGQILNETHKKKLRGKWSNPDFSLLNVHKFLHAPNKVIDVVSIEVKHATTQFDVSCVYEALAHTRASNYSVLFICDDPTNNISARGELDTLEEVKIECVRLGIGLVVSEYPCDINYWKYIIPAKEHKPDLRRVDAFIEDAFGPDDKNWLKQAL